jgi:hypothetical protein
MFLYYLKSEPRVLLTGTKTKCIQVSLIPAGAALDSLTVLKHTELGPPTLSLGPHWRPPLCACQDSPDQSLMCPGRPELCHLGGLHRVLHSETSLLFLISPSRAPATRLELSSAHYSWGQTWDHSSQGERWKLSVHKPLTTLHYSGDKHQKEMRTQCGIQPG